MLEPRYGRRESSPTPRAIVTRCRILGIVASATILLLAGLLHPPSNPAHGGTNDPSQSDKNVQPPLPVSPQEFIAEIHRTLKIQHDHMIGLADHVFRFEEAFRRAQDQLPSQKTLVEAAQARYENAKLTREVAEIRVSEFKDGRFVQNLAEAEGEIKVAREEITLSREGTKQAQDRLARIQQASNGTVVDLSLEFDSRAKVFAAQLQEHRARLALEQAESKKKLLLDYTKGKRLRELQSDVQKARSEELARQATWELEKAKVKRFEAEAKEQDPPPDVKHVLVLFDQATSLQEQIRAKLEQVSREKKLVESLQREIQDLTSQFRATVEEADGERAALQFDKLKPRIRRAASRLGTPMK